MRKRCYFDVFSGPGWPTPGQLQHYFLAVPGKRWTFHTGNDSWNLRAEGVDGTENLEVGKGRIDVTLEMYGHPELGVMIIYSKVGGGYSQYFTSKGDLSRLHELVLDLHDTPLPAGLFVSYEVAWKAVKEFVENDGAFPASVEWIANRDLPPNTFPESTQSTAS